MDGERWNSSLHALELLLREVPAGAERGLDVGCGEGETARRLRRRVRHVTGIDPDAASIDAAQQSGDDIDYRLDDLLTTELEPASFDVVTAVGVVHHLDHRAALEALARLVRPGGVLLVVGLARSRSVRDLARDGFDAVALRRHSLTKGVWETPAPKVWPPPLSHAELRQATREVLPGAVVRRMPYFRSGITWAKPSGGAADP